MRHNFPVLRKTLPLQNMSDIKYRWTVYLTQIIHKICRTGYLQQASRPHWFYPAIHISLQHSVQANPETHTASSYLICTGDSALQFPILEFSRQILNRL